MVFSAAAAVATIASAMVLQQRDGTGGAAANVPLGVPPVAAFQPIVSVPASSARRRRLPSSFIYSTRERNQQESRSTWSFSDDGDRDESTSSSKMDDDEWLLQTVTEAQLLDLCEQLNLDLGEGAADSSSSPSSSSAHSPSESPGTNNSKNNKAELLRILRAYAAQQRDAEERRRKERDDCVERGSRDDASKERYETVVAKVEDGGIIPEDDDDDFYIALPVLGGDKGSDESTGQEPNGLTGLSKSSLDDTAEARGGSTERQRSTPGWTSSASVTAPPPPEHVNEDGERAVTIYSSTDHNDLTGIAAAQPGYGSAANAATTSAAGAPQPWDSNAAAASTHSPASGQQVESARELISELVRCLLAASGAPAFSAGYDDDDDDDDDDDAANHNGDRDLSYQVRQFFRSSRRRHGAAAANLSPSEFVGFQPGSVPTPLLVAASPSLRLQRGQVLRDVLRKFELEAIGHDGRAGDNRESGGGHYREVAKVSAFLEGYRTSEVRRLARETTALLLDKLVQEGVEGLDVALATMARSSDDYRSDHAGELNDSLLEYLSDAIRQQGAKIRKESAALTGSQRALDLRNDDSDDNLSSLWTVEAGEDGRRVESIDPSDPSVREALQNEYVRIHETDRYDQPALQSPSQQLLFLLQLLKKRVEAEAAFAPDEKGRNLRLLAYCLRVDSDSEREQLILQGVGNSMDRIDSFMELVASSIEYGESTSHQLQPSKTKPLNVRRLQSIHDLCRQIRQRQPR